jgi:2-hydroxycyclohexanecarboxyl-CoA dehydrogenase
VITGGARGIGRAIATAFAENGADVVIGDLRIEEAAETASFISNATGTTAEAIRTDVTSLDDTRKLAGEAIRLLGRIDILVNAAGWDRLMPFVKTTPDLWDRIISINFRGVMNACYSVLPYMAERKAGAIVNISSDSARVGSFGEAVYAGSKAAIIAFSKTLAREHARDNIRVNVVCPGLVETPLIEEMRHDDFSAKILGSIVGFIPFKRMARPEEIPPMVLLLASDSASYITGQVVSVNGGLNMAG